jgi:hypothetical protein
MSSLTEPGELRYDAELGPGYFTLTPNDFLEHNNDLSTLAKLLYIVLLMHCGRGDEAFPGTERLCKLCGVKSRTTLLAARKELEAVGLVEVVQRGLNLTNLYVIHKYDLVRSNRGHSDVQNMDSRKVQKLNAKTSSIRTPKRPAIEQEQESVELNTEEQEIIPVQETRYDPFTAAAMDERLRRLQGRR